MIIILKLFLFCFTVQVYYNYAHTVLLIKCEVKNRDHVELVIGTHQQLNNHSCLNLIKTTIACFLDFVLIVGSV